MQAIGGALFERILFANGRILNPRFAQYRVPRFSDTPQVEVVLIDRKDLPSAGAGETGLVGLAPAVGNAIFAATGMRLRSHAHGAQESGDRRSEPVVPELIILLRSQALTISPEQAMAAAGQSPFFARNSRTTSVGSRCCPSIASFIARMSSAVTLPARAFRAACICGQRRSASWRTRGTAW